MSDTVGTDMVVGLEYVLKLEGGQEIDRSDEGDPLEYLHGHQNIIPGLESQLEGMKVGESKEIAVSPADAYGEHDPDEVEDHPRSVFPPELDLRVNGMLEIRDPANPGHTQAAMITAVSDETVTLDFNHPLAGETLHFSVKIASLRAASDEEKAHGHAHGAHGHH